MVSTEVAAPSFRAAGAAPESIFGFSFVIDRHESPLAYSRCRIGAFI